jgi:hypothetical protein
MGKAFRLAGTLAMTAMLGTAASPALADGPYGPYYGPYHHHHHDHDDGFGTFLGVAAVIGAVAVLAANANRNKPAVSQAPPPANNYPAAPRPNDYPGAPPSGSQGRWNDSGAQAAPAPSAEDNESAGVPDDGGAETIAVNDCAAAARDQGSRDGTSAEVRDITGTHPAKGGWTVEGVLDQREGGTRSFSCSWRDGRVGGVSFSGDSIAMR